ncbi:MAG: hypothetical protein RLY20_1974 [Verrucomicrobiota bacterium]|jgi:hypothetical protein
MFTILGADGKEYGPVGVEELRRWIREGRAGGQTQVRPEGRVEWVALQTLPEVAEVFTAPKLPGEAGSIPIVRTLAVSMFVIEGIGFLLSLVGIIGMLSYLQRPDSHLSPLAYVSWAIALVALPTRITAAVGLLRCREWARKLAIIFAAFLLAYGLWGWASTITMWAKNPEFLRGLIQSPMYLIMQLWSVFLLIYNAATILILLRSDVRAGFGLKKSAPPL